MREPTEMELRVARAIHSAKESQAPLSIRVSWEQCEPESRNHSLLYARAAIRAMREPTAEMMRDGRETGTLSSSDHYGTDRDAENVWQAMIDAASPPEPG